MDAATLQPELYTIGKDNDNLTKTLNERVFAPVCLLNHKYYIDKFPEYYFIVRKDLYCNEAECERVCLYQQGVVNEYLAGNDKPFTLWISNDLRNGRRIERIYRDIEEYVEDRETVKKIRK